MKTALMLPRQGAHCAGTGSGLVDLPALTETEAAAKARNGVARR